MTNTSKASNVKISVRKDMSKRILRLFKNLPDEILFEIYNSIDDIDGDKQ